MRGTIFVKGLACTLSVYLLDISKVSTPFLKKRPAVICCLILVSVSFREGNGEQQIRASWTNQEAWKFLEVGRLFTFSLAVAESIDTGTMRNGMRSCPVGQFIVGVDMDGNRLLCSNQPVVNSSAPYTNAFEKVDTSTFVQGLKACPTGYGMTGLSVVQSKVSCAHIGKVEATRTSNVVRSNTRACPAGRVMLGFDDDSNQVLCGRRIDSCFGAIGSRCGVTSEPFDTPFSLCLNNQCLINAGSWDHDECCWLFPNGELCRAPGAPHDGRCSAALSKTISRLSAGYNWRRNINFSTENSTGVVVRNSFCAQEGWIVHRSDVGRCCSGTARLMASALSDPIRAARDLAKATAQGLSPAELASGNPRVCL